MNSLPILLLEDNSDFADIIITEFKEKNIEVNVTNNAVHAIELFDNHHYLAIISDLHLEKNDEGKGASGLELIKHIRKKRKSDIFIVMCTGLDLVEEKEILRRGVDLFFHKPLPFSFEKFVELILEKAQEKSRKTTLTSE